MKLTNAWALDLMCSLVIMEIFSSCFKFSRSFLARSYSCDFFFFWSHYSIVFRGNTHTA